jgi:hypothetical protein
MTPVKPQRSNFQVDNSCQVDFDACYGGCAHERLLSESNGPIVRIC